HKQGNPRDGSNNNNGNRCSYKEILACQPKEFDGKGGAIVYTQWVEKMESVIDMSNFAINKRVKYAAGIVNRKSMILNAGGLSDDAVRNELLKRSSEKRKESGETGKQEDARSNYKRARTGKGFISTESCKKEYKVFTLSVLGVATIIRRLQIAIVALTAINWVIWQRIAK
nr:reverse transcriptase domain-containing protein [Tanacetum cinerariifolium]